MTLVAFADEDYDSNHAMSINGAWGSGFNKVQQAVQMAASAFARITMVKCPVILPKLFPTLEKPIAAATVQKYLSQIAADPPPSEVITIAPALKAYSDAHNGLMPKIPSDLQPFITTSEQQEALQKLIQRDSGSK